MARLLFILAILNVIVGASHLGQITAAVCFFAASALFIASAVARRSGARC